jgi:TPP-dependent 2-oxoacid decarboxylase
MEKIMDRAKLTSLSSRGELIVVAGTIVTMALSSVCVVAVCAAANEATETAAKVIRAAPAASDPGSLGTPADVAGASVWPELTVARHAARPATEVREGHPHGPSSATD